MDPHAIPGFDGEVHCIPPGYKFQPDDMELIEYYLKPKINGDALPLIPGLIHEVDVYTISPQHLNEKYKREGEHCMYFFTPRNRKYSKGNRPNRVVGEFGFWRATGADRLIQWNAAVIGTRKSLVFFEGKHKEPVKTNWHMQEFTLNNKDKKNHQNVSLVAASSDTSTSKLDDWVLCKIYQIKHQKENPKNEEVNKHEATTPTKEVIPPQNHPNQNYEALHQKENPKNEEVNKLHEATTRTKEVIPPNQNYEAHHEHIELSSSTIIEDRPFPIILSLPQISSLPPLPPSLSMSPLNENLTFPPFSGDFYGELSYKPMDSLSIPLFNQNSTMLPPLPSLSIPSSDSILSQCYHHNPSLDQNTTLSHPHLLTTPPFNQNSTPPPPLPPPSLPPPLVQGGSCFLENIFGPTVPTD